VYTLYAYLPSLVFYSLIMVFSEPKHVGVLQ